MPALRSGQTKVELEASLQFLQANSDTARNCSSGIQFSLHSAEMGRHPSSGKPKLRKGLWSPEEDEKLYNHIISFGIGCWSSVPKQAGLQRCGKSCRLRWINYLRPDLKRGSFSQQEEDLIISLHEALGNRWSQIAAKLAGRTDNEIKNFWNSCLKKKLKQKGIDPATHKLIAEKTAEEEKPKAMSDHSNTKQAPVRPKFNPFPLFDLQADGDLSAGTNLNLPHRTLQNRGPFEHYSNAMTTSSYVDLSSIHVPGYCDYGQVLDASDAYSIREASSDGSSWNYDSCLRTNSVNGDEILLNWLSQGSFADSLMQMQFKTVQEQRTSLLQNAESSEDYSCSFLTQELSDACFDVSTAGDEQVLPYDFGGDIISSN